MINPSDFKILVSDDSLLARKKLKDALAILGYTNIVEAKDGMEAIEFYKQHRPDLVFMDIVMPNTYGIEALREIKAVCSDVPVIMLSSTGTKANITEAVKCGADDFLVKPFTNVQIRTVLEKVNP